MQGKQAKIVSPIQERAILGYLATTRYPARDQVMFLLLSAAIRNCNETVQLKLSLRPVLLLPHMCITTSDEVGQNHRLRNRPGPVLGEEPPAGMLNGLQLQENNTY